jgi:hypothetical protein
MRPHDGGAAVTMTTTGADAWVAVVIAACDGDPHAGDRVLAIAAHIPVEP